MTSLGTSCVWPPIVAMQGGAEEHNKERQKAGYKAVHLVGWAEKPHYDSTSKKLYWAKEFQFEGAAARSPARSSSPMRRTRTATCT